MTGPATLGDKVWSAHAIAARAGATLLHVDGHRVHDGSRECGLRVRRPHRTFATPDHDVAMRARGPDAIDVAHRRLGLGAQITAFEHAYQRRVSWL